MNILKLFKMFFGKIFLWGIVAILVSCIISLKFDDIFWVKIFADLISTVGVALMIGSIFDFSRNTEEFTSFVSGILKKIIVTKEFLGELENDKKKGVLELLVTPTNSQIEQYSSINQYYKKSIDKFMELYNQPFKTNLSIHIIAKIEDNKVICEGKVSYRRYKINEKYDPIDTNFERNDSKILNSYILLPNGDRYDLNEGNDIDVKENLKNEKIAKKYKTVIPEICNQYPYITLCKEIKEIGYDHWIIFDWSSLTPCDGISFELICNDDLIIKEYKIFDDAKLYEVNINEDKDNISILSTSWLNEYTGFALTISKK